MNNKDLPAYPIPEFLWAGMSQRTLIAGMCLQGLLANSSGKFAIKERVDLSIKYADELLTKLNADQVLTK